MQLHFSDVHAWEILDSHGNPTVEIELRNGNSGTSARASIPSGAAIDPATDPDPEPRDRSPSRYVQGGVETVLAQATEEIRDLLLSRSFTSLADLDSALIGLDAVDSSPRLAAGAMLGVSMAAARGFAAARGQNLWQYLAPDRATTRLPVPHVTVLNCGSPTSGDLGFHEFMIAPIGARDERAAVRAGVAIHRAVRARLAGSGHITGQGREGGREGGQEGGGAPDVKLVEQALGILAVAIEEAGYPLGADGVAIAMHPAADTFHRPGGTYLVGAQRLTGADLVDWYAQLIRDFPICAITDGLAAQDRDGWIALTERIGRKVQVVGGEIFADDPVLIAGVAGGRIGNAALITPARVGTVTEALEAAEYCRKSGYAQILSHHLGETTDDFIADLAVATGCGQIKAGPPTHGENIAKYNRLTRIEETAGLPYGL